MHRDLGGFLEGCREATSSDARFTWVGEQFLLEKGVEPWGGLPLWIPESDEKHRYFLAENCDKAFRAVAPNVHEALEEASAARDAYLRALDALHAGGLESNVSLKLTQFGLALSSQQCRAIRNSQTRKVATSRKVGRLVQALRKVSWATSSARCCLPVNPYSQRRTFSQ